MGEPRLHIGIMTRAVLAHGIGGGMEIHAETLRRGLVAAGHRVTMITTALASGATVIEDEWGATHFVGGGPPITYTSGWWRESLQRLLSIHRTDPFDVIGGHGKAIYAYLGAKRRLAPSDHIPVVVITHQNIVCDFQALLKQFPRYSPSVLRWLPTGASLYADDLHKLRLADCVTATNDLNGVALRRWFPLASDQIEVIHNSVNVQAFEAAGEQREAVRERLGVDSDTLLILTLARLERRKGQHYLFESLTRPEMRPYRSRVKVVLAGDGLARAKLESQVRRAGLEDVVTFLGLIPHADVPSLLSAADIVVHPALNEGKSLAMLEAMACGRPVIAASIDANAEFVEDGQTGILVPPARPDALARAIAELISDPARARAIGAQAHARVATHYDEPLMLARYEQVFQRAAQSPRMRAAPHRTAGARQASSDSDALTSSA